MTAIDTDAAAVGDVPDRPGASQDGSWASVTAGAILVLLGAAWLLSLIDVVDLRAAYVLPSLLTLVGLALVAGSARGPHPGLIALGTFLAVATAFAAVAPPEALRGGLGERLHTVTNSADLDSRYELGIGDMTLDLSDLELQADREITVVLGAGNLDLVLPTDVPVSVTAESGAGEIILLGDKVDGVAVENSYQSPGYESADARLQIEIEVGAGSIEVDQ